MRLLADENMPRSVIEQLRQNGHDVLAVKESLRGVKDVEILARAQTESRVVISQDKDFGELAFRGGLPAQCGVVLFRLDGEDPDDDVRRMVEAVESRTDWTGTFGVVDQLRIRLRPLPEAGHSP